MLLARNFIKNKQRPKPTFAKIVKTVVVDTVENGEVPIILKASGNLVAKEKIELFSEVQGVMQPSRKDFKAGTSYRSGEVLLGINSDEFYASLQSQKSNLYNLLTSILPDIRLDYPNEFPKWQSYLAGFDMNKTTPKLPEFSSEKEKYFVSGRGVTTSYYNVKNLEVKLSKYRIRAPYNGILTEALVTPGTLIRVGQKLGEFIKPAVYELEVAISAEYAKLLEVGNRVQLNNLERTASYSGTVVRVNGRIDQNSQTIKAYIETRDSGLKEGMFLEADLKAKEESNAYKISRKLLVDNSSIYLVKDSVLELIPVRPVYFDAKNAIVKGIPDNSLILSQTVPGAYPGMPVKVNQIR